MKSLVLIAALLTLLSTAAMADVEFNFDYTGSYFSATGTLDLNGSGLATSGTGTLTYGSTSTAITLYGIDNPPSGVITARTSGGTDLIGLDNQVFPGSTPLLDVDGLIFWMGNVPPSGGLSQFGNVNLNPAGGFNIYYSQGAYQAFGANGSGLYAGDSGSFALGLVGEVAPLSVPLSIPEPGVASLLITMLAGIGGLAGVLRKRRA